VHSEGVRCWIGEITNIQMPAGDHNRLLQPPGFHQKKNPAKYSRTGFNATRRRHPALFILSFLLILSQALSPPTTGYKMESGEISPTLLTRAFHPVYPVHPC